MLFRALRALARVGIWLVWLPFRVVWWPLGILLIAVGRGFRPPPPPFRHVDEIVLVAEQDEDDGGRSTNARRAR